MKNRFVLANDIGGTHITSAVIDTSNWSILQPSLVRASINSGSDAKTILSSWTQAMKKAIDQSSKKNEIIHIGIAMPGPFDYEEGISLIKGQNKYDKLYKVNVKTELLKIFGQQIEDIRFINDAASFLQGEIFVNGIAEKGRILGITLGTGLGSAVWEKEQKAFDADLWNTPYNDRIFEEYLVTRFLVARFEGLSGCKEKGFKEIIELHQSTAEFKILLQEYCQYLFDFLDFFSKKHHSNSFIIGGSIAKAWDIITKDHKSLFSPFEIRIGKSGEKAAILGAATLFE